MQKSLVINPDPDWENKFGPALFLSPEKTYQKSCSERRAYRGHIMENRKHLFRIGGIGVILVMTIFLMNPGTIEAQEQCKLVTISGQAFPEVTITI